MNIQSVRMNNTRTLQDMTIPFDAATAFIRQKVAGKSAVLRALDWFFTSKSGSLTKIDSGAACTDVESGASIIFQNNQLAYRTTTGKTEGQVPVRLMHILARAEVSSHA